jgi:hypothetical protein
MSDEDRNRLVEIASRGRLTPDLLKDDQIREVCEALLHELLQPADPLMPGPFGFAVAKALQPKS